MWDIGACHSWQRVTRVARNIQVADGCGAIEFDCGDQPRKYGGTAVAGLRSPTAEVCCTGHPQLCGSTGAFGQTFDCSTARLGYGGDAVANLPASVARCCVGEANPTCTNVDREGADFDCGGNERAFNPAAGDATPPSAVACCTGPMRQACRPPSYSRSWIPVQGIHEGPSMEYKYVTPRWSQSDTGLTGWVGSAGMLHVGV